MTRRISATTVTDMQLQNRDHDASIATTPTQRLASLLLGRDVNEFIAERRAAGRPWRYVARDLYDATEGQVDVTYETLRQWHEVAA